ncbi:response regulator [Cohnella sp. GCM10012308]|uniref:response regulator transcription factor n=1 Tax=Cohnella sp. GCM10012308 TaxID=3317329 RepID=UPI00360F438B
MLKALIIDDEYWVRAGIRDAIGWNEMGVEIVGEAENGEDGLELALRHEPDVIVTDVRMPHMNGLELIAALRERKLNASIIVLSGYDEFQYAQAAMRHGASAYLLKPIDPAELADSVCRLGQEARERLASRELVGRLVGELPALARQYWLDLLQAAPADEAEGERKRILLQLPDLGATPHAVALVARHSPAAGGSSGERLGEPLIRGALEANSVHASALLRLGIDRWAVAAACAGSWETALEGLRAFGRSLAAAARAAGCSDVAVGIGTPAGSLSELHVSCRAASDAAAKAAAEVTSVRYALDEGGAGTRREIREALAYMRKHYASNVTAEAIAAEVFVSPTHLMHLFRRELNKTLYECLTEFRLEEAKRMLRDGRHRVYEVCELAGFGDPKHFSQLFKKLTGMSPSDYAKSHV